LDKPLSVDEDVDDLAAIATEGGELAPLEEPEPVSSASAKVTNKSFDSLLLTLASVSLLLTGGFWVLAQALGGGSPAEVATVPVETESSVPVDREFMNYLQRSLEVVDEQAELADETAALASRLDLPEVGVPGEAAAPGMTNLGQPYVPVYQLPPAPAVNGTVPPVPGGVAIAPSPTITTTPVQPAPAAPAAPSTEGSVPNIAATNTHVLVGLLELGDRSAALFEINGTAQRLELGETIGSSGWTLVSVSNQEAIIRRNGEVRSVYVGQRF